MKITSIKQQVKQQGRYSIFVEGKYSFSLSELALLDSKLSVGQELEPAQVKEYKRLSADDKIYNMALRYAASRPHSEWELREYLKRKNSPAPLVEKILNKLSEIRLLDDRAFAEAWVASRRLLKPVSRRRLVLELRQKHVTNDIIESVLAEDPADEQEVLKELIARKRKQVKYQDDTKLMQYLARQGFNYDDIKSAINEED